MLAYAESGDTKTSQAYYIAKRYFALNPSKKGRIITADGGGIHPFEASGWLDSGQVQHFNLIGRKTPLADCRRLSKGYWPIGDEFRAEEKFRSWEKENVGIGIIDGITGTAKVLLGHMQTSEDKVGFKEAWKYEEDGETFKGLTEGHYGIVQRELYSLIQNFNTLPVDILMYTARVGKGERKRNKESVYGPQGAGNADTPDIPSWVHDTLHLERVNITAKNKEGDKVTQERVVAWFQEHKDPETDVPYLAKCRLMPELMPELLKRYPKGWMLMRYDKGLAEYLDVIEELEGKGKV